MFPINKSVRATLIISIVSLLLCYNLGFATDEESSTSQIFSSFKASVSANIYPVCIEGRYRFVSYHGHYVNNYYYNQVFCRYPENRIQAFGNRDKIWFRIDSSGNETQAGFPQGFDPIGSNASYSLSDNIFCLKNITDPSKTKLERLYDTKQQKFITEYLGACTYSAPYWIGMAISSLSNDKKNETYAILHQYTAEGDILQTKTQLERAYLRNSFILGFPLTDPSHPAIFDLDLNVVASSNDNYIIYGNVHENRILARFIHENSMGFIDTDGKIICKGFDLAYPFSDGMAVIGKETEPYHYTYGYIDIHGKITSSCQYYDASKYVDGVAFVSDRKNNRTFAIDKSGTTIFAFEKMLNPGSLLQGVSLEETGQGIVLINLDGEVIWKSSVSNDISKMKEISLYTNHTSY